LTSPTYLLHVDLALRDVETHPKFESAVLTFLNAGGFPVSDSGPTLVPVYLLRAVVPPGAAPAKEAKNPGYVHFWNVPNIQSLDLAQLMSDNRDNVVYKAIDQYVSTETQDFIYYDPFHDFQPPVGPPPANLRYVWVTHQFAKTEDYGNYSAYALLLIIYLGLAGWKNIGIFWSVTGRLNTFSELWSVDESIAPASSSDILPKMLEAIKAQYPTRPANATTYYFDLSKFYEELTTTTRLLLESYAYETPPTGQNAGAAQWAAVPAVAGRK
jgi:hypothetical protein